MRRAAAHRPSDFSQSNGVRICSISGCSGRSRRSLNAAGADAAAIETAARNSESVLKLGGTIRRVIVVPGRLVNVVVA